jgi:hypothetical protein
MIFELMNYFVWQCICIPVADILKSKIVINNSNIIYKVIITYHGDFSTLKWKFNRYVIIKISLLFF